MRSDSAWPRSGNPLPSGTFVPVGAGIKIQEDCRLSDGNLASHSSLCHKETLMQNIAPSIPDISGENIEKQGSLLWRSKKVLPL